MDPERNRVASKPDGSSYILMTSNIAACKWVTDPVDRFHCLAAFLLFGVIEDELDDIALA